MIEWVVEPLVPTVFADVSLQDPGQSVRVEVAAPPVAVDRYVDSVIDAEERGEDFVTGSGRYAGPASLFSPQQRTVVDELFDRPHVIVEDALRLARARIPSGWRPTAGDPPPSMLHVLVQQPELDGVELFVHLRVPFSATPVVVRLVRRELAAAGC